MVNYIILLLLFIHTALSQDCDTSSNVNLCSEGEICMNNGCEHATSCDSGVDCIGNPGTVCVADYCQPPKCTATGQCVFGQTCSKGTQDRSCVYPVKLFAKEGAEVKIKFPEPAIDRSYREISWYKGSRSSIDRMVLYNPAISTQPVYLNDYCLESNLCNMSHKGELDSVTGDWLIYQVHLSDEDFYYYTFYSVVSPDTGFKYEIDLEVFVLDQMDIKGLSDVIEPGSGIEFTCTVKRIKPKASEMFWTLNGKRYNGTTSSELNDDGITWTMWNVAEFNLAEGDENHIQCTVVPVYGDPVMISKEWDSGNNGQVGMIAGIVVAVLFLLIIIVGLVFAITKRYSCQIMKKKNKPDSSGPLTVEHRTSSRSQYNGYDNFVQSQEYDAIDEAKMDNGYLQPVPNVTHVYDQAEEASQENKQHADQTEKVYEKSDYEDIEVNKASP